jgi:hypothetical protein
MYPVCSFCGDSAVIVWFEGPDFRSTVESAEQVRSDEAYLACATCLAPVEANDRDGLAAREMVRQRRKGGLKPGVTEEVVIQAKRAYLDRAFLGCALGAKSGWPAGGSYGLDGRWGGPLPGVLAGVTLRAS